MKHYILRCEHFEKILLKLKWKLWHTQKQLKHPVSDIQKKQDEHIKTNAVGRGQCPTGEHKLNINSLHLTDMSDYQPKLNAVKQKEEKEKEFP